MIYKRIVILANSRKHSGRCLAGREIVGQQWGGWVRPISARPGAEVSEWERQYENGSDPKVLDIVDVPLLGAKPSDCHTENWLVQPDHYWIKAGEMSWDQAHGLSENPAKLWNSGDSTYNGNNDQIEKSAGAGLTTSIAMISVDKVEIQVLVPGAAFGNPKKRVQARFSYRGVNYWLWVTDPIERQYLNSNISVHQLGPCLLTVSLAEPYEVKGAFYYYKLVAAIIPRD